MNEGLVIVLPLLIFFMIDVTLFANSIRQGSNTGTVKIFSHLAGCVMISQGLTVITYACDWKLMSLSIPMQYTANFISLTCMTIAPYMWLEYLLITGKDTEKYTTVRYKIIFAVPVMILFLAGIPSQWTHWLFFIDSEGVYQPGTMHFLQYIGYVYYIAAFIFAIAQIEKGRPATDVIYKVAIYVLPMAVGTAANNMIFRGGYTQIGCSYSVFLLYLEQYITEVNENKRLKSMEALNERLKDTNEALVNQMGIVGGLSNAYFSVYNVNLVTGRCKAVKVINFFRELVGDCSRTDEIVEAFVNMCVMPEDREKMSEFTRWRELGERLAQSDTMVQEFHGMISPWEWCRASWIVSERNEDGKAVSVLFTVEDITENVIERKRREQELEESRMQAEAANKAKTDFLFNMSHDIRTPMNAIIGYAALMEKNSGDSEKCQDYLGKIKNSSSFLLSLINNVLEMARIESGKLVLDEKVCRIMDIIDEITSVYSELMKKKGINFNIDIDINAEYYYIDKVKLSEIFLNILSNAYKYTDEGGSITMTTRELEHPQDGYIILETKVADTGIGMSEEYLPKIFEEFSREHTSTESRVEGTGLGMAIVKKIVDFMGGTIEVTSKLGEGTEFVVTLPHRLAEAGDMQTDVISDINPEKYKGRRILLVEDNDLNAEIATEILREYGFVIERAEDGIVCIDMISAAEAGYYDLILMDVQMPNLDGYGATKKIRSMEDKQKADIPIIAMTANAFDEDRQNAIDCGMNAHIAKPLDIPGLMKILVKVLG